MKMRRRFSVMSGLLGLLLCGTFAQGADLQFSDHGKFAKSLDVKDLKTAPEVKDVKVWDANEEKDVTYKAVSVRTLLDQIYGPGWRKSEEIVLTCLDGYNPSIPVQRFIEHSAFFAVARSDNGEFTIVNQHEHGKKINVGPVYLVWDNENANTIKNESDGSNWPYQVTALDLQTFSEAFPRMAPLDNAGPKAKAGFLAFRRHCMGCHTVNGDGGKGGPELNYPVNITEYYRIDWLKKWIDDPTTIRYKTGMPGLSKEVPFRAKTRDEILAYLQAMKNRKVAPRDQP